MVNNVVALLFSMLALVQSLRTPLAAAPRASSSAAARASAVRMELDGMTKGKIDELIKDNKVMLFMKGAPAIETERALPLKPRLPSRPCPPPRR